MRLVNNRATFHLKTIFKTCPNWATGPCRCPCTRLGCAVIWFCSLLHCTLPIVEPLLFILFLELWVSFYFKLMLQFIAFSTIFQSSLTRKVKKFRVWLPMSKVFLAFNCTMILYVLEVFSACNYSFMFLSGRSYSRMTVGKMIELLGSKAGVSCGQFHYGSAFGEPSGHADRVETIRSIFLV